MHKTPNNTTRKGPTHPSQSTPHSPPQKLEKQAASVVIRREYARRFRLPNSWPFNSTLEPPITQWWLVYPCLHVSNNITFKPRYTSIGPRSMSSIHHPIQTYLLYTLPPSAHSSQETSQNRQTEKNNEPHYPHPTKGLQNNHTLSTIIMKAITFIEHLTINCRVHVHRDIAIVNRDAAATIDMTLS